MDDQPQELPVSRFRFSLRALIALVAVIAVMLVVGRSVYDWYTSIPLSEAVAEFNRKASTDPVGRHEPPVTEDEIVRSIEAQLPTLDASSEVKTIFTRIARTRRLPRDASLNVTPGYGASPVEVHTVWWINIDVMTGPTTGYTLRIRKTDNPVAASDSNSLRG